MIEKARLKIEEELKNSKNPALTEIGAYLLKQLEINAASARAIVKEGKTVNGALLYMMDIARKDYMIKDGATGAAYIPPNEGYKIVNKYFEIEAVQDKMIKVETEEIKEDLNIKEEKKRIEFSANLDDFLND